MEGDIITMQDIFIFEKDRLTAEGKVTGRFRATGCGRSAGAIEGRGHQPAA
jgi:hypothetical protein